MTTDPLALGAVRAYCGWDPTTYLLSEVTSLDGNGTALAFLPTLALDSITAITVTDVYGATFTINPVADVEYNRSGQIGLKPTNPTPYSVWPVGLSNLVVTWSGGNHIAPDDVAAAAASIGGRLAQMGLQQASIGTARLQYGAANMTGDLLDVEKYVLDNYRIMRVSEVN